MFTKKKEASLEASLDEIDDEVVLGGENVGEDENVGESDGKIDNYSSGNNEGEISDTLDEY